MLLAIDAGNTTGFRAGRRTARSDPLADRHRCPPNRRPICRLASSVARDRGFSKPTSTASSSPPWFPAHSTISKFLRPNIMRPPAHRRARRQGCLANRNSMSMSRKASAPTARSTRSPAHAKHHGRPDRHRFRHRDDVRRGRFIAAPTRAGSSRRASTCRSTRWSAPPPSCRASRSRRPATTA